FNPTKGLLFDQRFNAGTKTILKNESITSIEGLENIYDQLTLKTIQLESELDVSYFLPAGSWGTTRFRTIASYKYNPQGILLNEFYRLGGNKLLRGFDEESIQSDAFGLISAEFRLLLDRNSYLTLPFVDFGYTRIMVDQNLLWDQVLGVGMG